MLTRKSKNNLVKVVLILLGSALLVGAIGLILFGWWFYKSIEVPASSVYNSYIASPLVSELNDLEGNNVHFREGPLLIIFSTSSPVVLKDQIEFKQIDFNTCVSDVGKLFEIPDLQKGECVFYREEVGQTLKSERWLLKYGDGYKYILAVKDY